MVEFLHQAAGHRGAGSARQLLELSHGVLGAERGARAART